MVGLHTSRLKPNPAGKDRSRYSIDSRQLAAEWVDITNSGGRTLSVGRVVLYHLAYPRAGGKPEWAKVCGLSGNLGPGKVLRIHSGRPIRKAGR